MMVIKKLKTAYRYLELKANLHLRLFLSKKDSRQGDAFLIVGAPRTGTKMLTRFFIYGGCSGNGEGRQIHEFCNPSIRENKVVWKTNIPYASSKTGNIHLIYKLLKKLGYNLRILWIERDRKATIQSQIKRGHGREKTERRIDFAQDFLKKFTRDKDFIKINYERFVEDKNYRKELAKKCNIKYRKLEGYKNQNKSHRDI